MTQGTGFGAAELLFWRARASAAVRTHQPARLEIQSGRCDMKLRFVLAAAGAVLAPCAAPAGVSGQVTLGQFSYTLTDLDPNDGVKPSIVFLAPGSAYQPAWVRVQWESGAAMSEATTQSVDKAPVSQSHVTPLVTLAASATGLADLGTTSLHAEVSDENDPFGSAGGLTADAVSGLEPFVLSPHTALNVSASVHISGDARPGNEMDIVGMGGWVILQGADGIPLAMFTNDPVPSLNGNGGPYDVDTVAPLTGTYVNDSALSINGSLQLSAGLTASVFWFAEPVPEPANIAMYAAGLPLLLALRRRVRRSGDPS
jgi:hypothetical protein